MSNNHTIALMALNEATQLAHEVLSPHHKVQANKLVLNPRRFNTVANSDDEALQQQKALNMLESVKEETITNGKSHHYIVAYTTHTN